MKFIIISIGLLLFLGAVAAQTQTPQQHQGRVILETLQLRADTLLQRVHQTLQAHRHTHHHLLHSLERQAVLVEALALDLKRQLADPNALQHVHLIHAIEEDLLHLENSVAEEIDIIRHFTEGGQQGETAAQLIARGQKLVSDAKEAVAQHPKAKEVGEITSEVIVLEALIKAIQAKPAAPGAPEATRDEEELARVERTLRLLIEKAAARRDH